MEEYRIKELVVILSICSFLANLYLGLNKYRNEFFFPNFHKNEVVYFTGNSLGLPDSSPLVVNCKPVNLQDFL